MRLITGDFEPRATPSSRELHTRSEKLALFITPQCSKFEREFRKYRYYRRGHRAVSTRPNELRVRFDFREHLSRPPVTVAHSVTEHRARPAANNDNFVVATDEETCARQDGQNGVRVEITNRPYFPIIINQRRERGVTTVGNRRD